MLQRSTIVLGLMLTGSLSAAVLVGEDETQSSESVAPNANRRLSALHKTDAPALPKLQLEKLARAEASEPEHDPFAGKSWYVPPPPPPAPKVVVEAPRPTAPSFPFAYMGRLQEEGEHEIVYLTKGNQAYSVAQGDTIENTYRVESITSTQIVLTYLPLETKQTLTIGNASLASMDMMAVP